MRTPVLGRPPGLPSGGTVAGPDDSWRRAAKPL